MITINLLILYIFWWIIGEIILLINMDWSDGGEVIMLGVVISMLSIIIPINPFLGWKMLITGKYYYL